MDLKKIIGSVTKDKLLSGAANKILPMEGDDPKVGPKAKLAAILATVAAVAGALSHFLGG